MAKKAKRRGRPPGSKNKKSVKGNVAKMDVAALRDYIDDLQGLLAKKVNEQRSFLERQLSDLGGFVSKKATAAYKAVAPSDGRRGKRAPAKPKYRSKAHPHTTWSGRGMTPVWMRDEMKRTKLKKEDFLIA